MSRRGSIASTGTSDGANPKPVSPRIEFERREAAGMGNAVQGVPATVDCASSDAVAGYVDTLPAGERDAGGCTPMERVLRARAGSEAERAARQAALKVLFAKGAHRDEAALMLAEMRAFAASVDNMDAGESVPTTPAADALDSAANAPAAAATDAVSELLHAPADDRPVALVKDAAAAPPPPLKDWVLSLSNVEPPLGYTPAHCAQLLTTARRVVRREAEKLQKIIDSAGDAPALEDWMVVLPARGAAEGLELFLAGALYTMDLVERVDGRDRTIMIDDDKVLRNHGIDVERVRREGGTRWSGQRLPLYYTMNTAMRGAAPRIRSGDTPPPQQHVLDVFNPLMLRVRELVHTLPSRPMDVFRGIDVNVSARYRVGSSVVWDAFTSTSCERDVAAAFMSKDKDGTFFVIVSRDGAAPVEFCAEYAAERELLYTCGVRFRVMWKLSPTLLRMLGVAHDVVVMQEAADDAAAEPEVWLFKEVFAEAMTFAKGFLDGYIEGRVGRAPVVPEGDADTLSSWLGGWVGTWDVPRAPRCLVGVGGSGKTSASVAAVSWLLGPDAVDAWRERGLAGARERWDRVLPIFVPLPAVGRALLRPGGIDEYVMTSLGLRRETLEQLGAQYDVVLVADSMDETGVTGRELYAAFREHGAASLLGLNAWARKHCSVIMTVREEYLTAHGLTAASLCGVSAASRYLQRFGEADATAYMEKRLAVDPAADGIPDNASSTTPHSSHADETPAQRLHRLFPWAMENPFVLSMLMGGHAALTRLQAMRTVREVDVYEQFILSRVGHPGDPDALEAAAAVTAGEVLACAMVATNTWQMSLKDAVATVARGVGGGVGDAAARACLKALPLRVEDWGNDDGGVSFRHKTLGEYLAARRIWGAPTAGLDLVAARAFSKDTPNVARFFAEHAAGACDAYAERVLPALWEAVAATGGDDGGVRAGNALALIARARVVVRGRSMAGAVVKGADLRHLVLSGVDMANATFDDCWLAGSEFNACAAEGVAQPQCDLGGELRKATHDAAVQAVAVFADGSKTVTGCDDAAVRVWDAASGAQLLQLNGHENPITSVAVFPDGSKIISGSADNTARVWNAASGAEVLKLDGHTAGVTGVAVWPDGSKVATGSADDTTRVWDAVSGAELQKMKGRTYGVNCVAVWPAGDMVVSGTRAETLVWDAGNGEVLKKLKGHSSAVTSVAVFPDGSNLATASRDKTIRIWDAATWAELRVLKGPTSCASCVAVWPDGSKIVGGSWDNVLRVWDAASGTALQQLEGHTESVAGVAVWGDGSRVLSGSTDKTFRIWDAASGTEPQKIEGHTDTVASVAIFPDGSKIASGAADCALRIWDTASGQELMVLEGHTSTLRGLAVWPGGSKVVSAGDDQTLRIWDVELGEEVQVVKGHTGGIRSVAVFPDGSKIVSGGDDMTLRVYDPEARTLVKQLRGHTDRVTSVAVSPDGTKIVSGSDDTTIRVWKTKTWKELQKLEGHSDYVYCLAFSPDGSQLVSGSFDKTIKVWDRASGRVLRTLEGHTSFVMSVAMSSDGARILSGAHDHTLRIWDAATGALQRTLEGHTDDVASVAVAADGSRIVTGSYDKTVRVWDAAAAVEGDGAALVHVLGVTEGVRHRCI